MADGRGNNPPPADSIEHAARWMLRFREQIEVLVSDGMMERGRIVDDRARWEQLADGPTGGTVRVRRFKDGVYWGQFCPDEWPS